MNKAFLLIALLAPTMLLLGCASNEERAGPLPPTQTGSQTQEPAGSASQAAVQADGFELSSESVSQSMLGGETTVRTVLDYESAGGNSFRVSVWSAENFEALDLLQPAYEKKLILLGGKSVFEIDSQQPPAYEIIWFSGGNIVEVVSASTPHNREEAKALALQLLEEYPVSE